AEIKKDPAKVVEKLEAEGVTLADVPAETKKDGAGTPATCPHGKTDCPHCPKAGQKGQGKGHGHGHKHRHGHGHSDAGSGAVMSVAKAGGGCVGGVCALPKAE
ncbi:MAG: hypothetical protein ACOCX4_09470, partial [Planctomycetota bacterium]